MTHPVEVSLSVNAEDRREAARALRRLAQDVERGLTQSAGNNGEGLSWTASVKVMASGAPHKLQALMDMRGMGVFRQIELFREVQGLMPDNFISCIKLVREATGAGLKEAKDAMDEVRDRLYTRSIYP